MSTTSLRKEESIASTNSGESFNFDYLQDDLLGEPVSQSNASPEDIASLPGPQCRLTTPLPPRPPGNSWLVIGIDYGTTFTGLSFSATSSTQADLKQIEVHRDWTIPKDGNHHDSRAKTPYMSTMNNLDKVPSVISFDISVNGEAQWGADINDNSPTMVNVKLELQAQDLQQELDLTYHLLKGARNLDFAYIREAGPEPAYTFRSPTEIITEYLKRVFECARARKIIDIEKLTRTKTHIDVVVTVPVEWGEQANDSMFKAVRGAGFNKETLPTLRDTILVSEPEAASHFIARHLHERGEHFLEVNDCFILCDAGGGTGDVVSFQVQQLKPFQLKKATEPTGKKCGSALIDTAFKEWLRREIGKEHYGRIDPANARSQRISPHTTENGKMRRLIKDFEAKKKAFDWEAEGPDIKLDLPETLRDLTTGDNVRNGELTIPREEMKDLMDTCVNEVIGLIQDQIKQVKDIQERRVRDVFLVGGFGASPYLRKELERSLKLRKMRLHQPQQDSSLTATAQGAVVYGIEKIRHSDCRYMGEIKKSYGVILGERFEWLIRKGDLVVSNQSKVINSRIFWRERKECTNDKSDFSVYYYRARDKDDDDVPEEWLKHEVKPAVTIKAEFRKVKVRASRFENPDALTLGTQDIGSSSDRIGPLQWCLKLSAESVEAELLVNGRSVGKGSFNLETDFSGDRNASVSPWDDSDE